MLFDEISDFLRKNNIESARLETRIIFGFVLDVDYQAVSGREEICEKDAKKIKLMAKKRVGGMPLDKIIGKKSFYKYDFFVNENVLSPRPETETLVEQAVAIIKEKNFSRVLDLGTGSGCILLSILGDCPKATGTGVDISSSALDVAEKNAADLGLKERINFVNASWNDENFLSNFSEKFDIIVTNPPYIAKTEKENLMKEVRCFDPEIALYGGDDGFEEYKNISEKAPCLLKDGGYIFIEAGFGQAEEISNIFSEKGFKKEKLVKDLSGVCRCVILKK